MSEAVPLCATLRVHVVDVIVGEVLVQCFDLLLENFATKSRLVGNIERKATSFSELPFSTFKFVLDWYNLARPDFLRSSRNTRRCKQVQSSNLYTH
jgi:hypothetical protein